MNSPVSWLLQMMIVSAHAIGTEKSKRSEREEKDYVQWTLYFLPCSFIVGLEGVCRHRVVPILNRNGTFGEGRIESPRFLLLTTAQLSFPTDGTDTDSQLLDLI